ncbi:MAG: hypothetical protein K8R06_03405 [Methanosarcinales archaeon]|nr:hypothetical protein [Methanosarcinales archaeon]
MLSIHPEVLLTLNSPGGSIITILSAAAIDFTSARSPHLIHQHHVNYQSNNFILYVLNTY